MISSMSFQTRIREVVSCIPQCEVGARRWSIVSWRSPLTQLLRSASPSTEVVVKLLNAKADARQRGAAGATPLHECARGGHLELLKVLLQVTRGAGLADVDDEGRTGLHYAAKEGHRAAVDLLLRVGSDPRGVDENGLRPAEVAAAAGHQELAELLAE